MASPTIESKLVGSTDFIWQARRVCKSLNAGMRQVGVIAALGIITLKKMSQRLKYGSISATFFKN